MPVADVTASSASLGSEEPSSLLGPVAPLSSLLFPGEDLEDLEDLVFAEEPPLPAFSRCLSLRGRPSIVEKVMELSSESNRLLTAG
jgi:hypothetical protein